LTELTGIGAELRRARESQGLAVADVAQQLKFASRQIDSLENERFDRLPGPTIARGMVRNYARLLNLDPEPLLERMSPKTEAPPDSGRLAERFRQPVPFSDSGRRSTLVYAGFSVAVLALVGVVAYEWQQERAAPQFVAPVQPPRAAEEEPPPPAPAQVAVAEPPAPPVEEKPAPPVEKKAAVEKPKPAAAAVPQAEPQPQVEPELQVATGNFHRIVVICEEESWVEVKDGTGRSLVSSLNPAGSERAVRGRGPFEIVIGNARGVRLLVDDKPVDLKPHTRVDVARLTIQ
jgi:cytoskeleton protein RodZ